MRGIQRQILKWRIHHGDPDNKETLTVLVAVALAGLLLDVHQLIDKCRKEAAQVEHSVEPQPDQSQIKEHAEQP